MFKKISVSIFILFIGVVGWTLFEPFNFLEDNDFITQHAAHILEVCSQKNYPPSCYDEEIPKLMDQGLSLEETFEVTTLIQKEDSRYYYCHVLGHNLSAKEAAKDPSDWLLVLGRCPTGQCSNGCLHGAFQERFRDEYIPQAEYAELITLFPSICDDSELRTFTGQERGSCYHALGHLAMYIHHANIPKSLALCNTLPETDTFDHSLTCYDAVFMQVFQPLDPEDIALVQDIAPHTQNQSRAFCDEYGAVARGSCNRESWPLFLEQIKSPEGIEEFCGVQESGYPMRRCYGHALNVLTAHFEFDETRLEAICAGLPKERQGQCYGDVAARFIEIDDNFISRASGFCKKADERDVGEACWKQLLFYVSLNTEPNTKRFEQFCRAFPDDNWVTRCLSNEGARLTVYEI